MTNIKLKPCPGCGQHDTPELYSNDLNMHRIVCGDCLWSGPERMTKAGAFEAWNTREGDHE